MQNHTTHTKHSSWADKILLRVSSLFASIGRTLQKVVNFYVGGFRRMSKTSRILWLIILIKLFIMFAVLKLFFFPNFLNTNFDTDEERSQYILESLTKTNKDD